MKIYKFRGKRVDNGEWVYGFYWTNELLNHFIRVTKDERDFYVIQDVEVLPETVGQFLHISDKNKTEIYEDDVIKSPRDYLKPEVVVFNAPQYHPFDDEYWNLGWREEECEVIGNIHDNPEWDERNKYATTNLL